jgi:uncharacterized coiled-coil protein SlyX
MAIWFTVLKAVPWSEVIRNAPKLADGAKRLWNAVATTSPPEIPAADEKKPSLPPDARAIAELEARVASAEAAMSELRTQMLASSELIQGLAEQNTQLIKRIETNRVHVLWLAAATAVVAIVAAAGLLMATGLHGA